MREQPHIGEERLRACLQDQYGIISILFEFLPLGHDYDAGVYRVVNQQGDRYLLKVTSRPLYEPSCLLPTYLRDQGIASIVAPVPTIQSTRWTKLDKWTAILYPWIDGDSSLRGMTNAQWQEVGRVFRQIHQTSLPPAVLVNLRKEHFDPSEYIQWIQSFEIQHLQELSKASPSQRALCSSWQAHRSTIQMATMHLQTLAEVLRSGTFPYVICHADLHARNLIRDQAGNVFVVDWDEVMLAPRERDFIFIREPHTEAFFQGYGDREVDWSLLAYYLWERFVQDVIYIANNVCFRDDWAEETRAQATQVFHLSLEPEAGNLRAAIEASVHLAGLSSPE